MTDNTVLDVSEDQFHDSLMCGISRMVVKLGSKTAAAKALSMTTQNLALVYDGSVPCAIRLFNALQYDEHLLDEVAALYRKKVVPKHHQEERAAPALAAALHKVIDAEEDGEIDHQELLAMECELRDADKRINAMLHRIAEIRKPRCVS